jgi:hypothetical protein
MIATRVHSARRRSAGKHVLKVHATLEESTVSDQTPTPNSSVTHGAAVIDAEQREAMIRRAAYLRAASRGFSPGQEIYDWLAAEAEIDRMLRNGQRPTLCGESG